MKASLAQLTAALDRSSPDLRFILLHGPDEAAAQDHAARLARAMGREAERVDLTGPALRANPAALTDEAAALSLFGGARHIRVTEVGDDALPAFEALLEAPRAGNPVVAIGPGLKGSSKLVKLATDSRQALAFACWAPTGQKADQLATQIARDHGLRTVGGAAGRLVEAAGGDRAIITREVEKLALYLDAAPDRPRELDDAALDAVGADLGEAQADRAIDALLDGRAADLGTELTRLAETGAAGVTVLRAFGRRLTSFAELRAKIDAGDEPGEAIKRARIPFAQEPLTARALRRWDATLLARALDVVRVAERAITASGTAGDILARDRLLAIGRAAERRR